MTEKGPLEAAIDVLEVIVKEHEQSDGWKDDVNDWKAAIRVLEAAGKVEKGNAEWVLCNITDIALGRYQKEWGVFYEQIRALLESLPEPEEERK